MPVFHTELLSYFMEIPVGISVFIPEEKGTTLKELYPSDKKYKTLYLLHGMHGDEHSWLYRSNVVRYAQEKQIALVMPSVQNSFYTDMKYGMDYFSFLTEELPRFVRSVFPLSVKREDTFIAGLSMGGYGAFKAGLSCPECYAAAASLSGALDITSIAKQASSDSQKKQYEAVFGPLWEAEQSPDNLFLLAEKQKDKDLPKFYFACGTEDTLCYPMNLAMKTCFDRLSIPFTYREGPGIHDWYFWDTYIQKVLDWLPL